MKVKAVSPRGVYYDLSKSPYEYIDSYGNVYKFSSLKKQSMFEIKVKIKEQEYRKEGKKLEQLGYIIDKNFYEGMRNIPAKVYNEMLYK